MNSSIDFSRIADAIDVAALQQSCVAVIGAGGSAGAVGNLARCGTHHWKLFDYDGISPSNVARQHHDLTDVGRPKVVALSDAIRRINPYAVVEAIEQNFLDLPPAALEAHVAESDLLILATDRFTAQARGNELALRYNVPAIFVGLYPRGMAGEIVYWHPGLDACYRCLCGKRYEAHEVAARDGVSLDPPSDGCTIFDVTLLDAIAGMLAVALLTRGSDNRFGRLIDALGDRNFIQVQLDPAWNLGGVNPVRNCLGVADDCPAFFAWNTIARSDPDEGRLYCPDCATLRGHRFESLPDGSSRRVRPENRRAERGG